MDNSKRIHLDENNFKKVMSPLTIKKEIFTSRKQSMDYFTVQGVILRTGYKNKRDWYLLPIREMLDNDADFLWNNYKGSNNVSIMVNVTMDNELFRLTIRNSNPKNITVFPDLKSIFDYEMRYGSKQDVHIITRGMLGDAMKQILSLGYVLLHANDDGTAFTDKQWEHPLIIRHNGKEINIYLGFNKATQSSNVTIEHSPYEPPHTDTEIELVLPVIDEVRNSLDRNCIEQFCRKYSILTTDISFKFRIIDDITHTAPAPAPEEDEDSELDPDLFDSDSDPKQELSKALSTVPEKGILNIDIPAIHPIASNWNNSDFIHSYKPEEFTSRITNVYDKESISVYEVLKKFREGSNIPKTPENQMSIAQLLKNPNKYKIIERLFNQLTEVLDAPKELSLPYTTNTAKRHDVLVERIGKLYDIDTGEKAKSSYKLVRGTYRDDSIQTLEYPFAFEIIAIPIKGPFQNSIKSRTKPHEFIGAVNYSVSPKNNLFEGDYGVVKGYNANASDIKEVLRICGFAEYGASYNRLPCVIVANLITPRRDPQGYDKSSIDTKPFVNVIKEAIEKISKEIQTFRAAGWTFSGRDNKDVSKHDINRKANAKNLLEQFLIRERGLPGTRNNLLGH